MTRGGSDTRPNGEVEEWPAAEPGEPVIGAVYDGSQAAARGVPVGGVLVGVNGVSVGRTGHTEVLRMVQHAKRPLALRVRCPPGWCSSTAVQLH